MKKNTAKDYAVALYETTKGKKDTEQKQIISEFAKVLFKKRKLQLAEKIVVEFEKFAKKQEGVVMLNITSAKKLTKAMLAEITKKFGKNIETNEKVDESIIGGFIVQTEDKIFDGSIKTQLKKLKQSLI